MNNLQVFNFENKEIRTVLKGGEIWFVGVDITDALEIDRSQLRRVEEEDRDVYSMHTLGGHQSVVIVNEPGLYTLVLGSRKPEAKEFKRWITHEVIPSIRKYGGYLTDQKIEEALTNPDTIIRLATQLKKERERRKQLQIQAEKDKPKVIFADAVSASTTSILVGELAKLLKQNGIETGQNRLFQWLRDNGYLIKRNGTDYNMPTQKSMELGLFEVKETCTTHSDGHTTINKTPKVTGYGQVYFINKFKGGN